MEGLANPLIDPLSKGDPEDPMDHPSEERKVSQDEWNKPVAARVEVEANGERDNDELEFNVESDMHDSGCRSVSGYFENGVLPEAKSQREDDECSCSTSTSTSIVESTASLNNVLPYPEFNSGPEDLLVMVDKPEKILATMDTYVMFRVTTKTKRPGYPKSDYSVKRRYSDFVWLRTKLEMQYPLTPIPPLPGKHNVYTLDRFDAQFVRSRMFGLDIFLKRLARHPSFTFHPDLKVFLIAEPHELSKHKKRSHNFSKSSPSDTWQNLATACWSFERDPEFARQMEYSFALNQRLLAVEKAAYDVHKEDQAFCRDSAAFCTVMNDWASTETSRHLKSSVEAVAEAMESSLSAQEIWTQCFEPSIGAPVHEWALYADVAKQILKRREYIEMEQYTTADALKKKKVEKEALWQSDHQGNGTPANGGLRDRQSWFGRDADAARDNKQLKLNQQIDELTHKVAKWDSQLNQANGEVRVEMEKWNRLKDSDLNVLLGTYARRKVEFHKQCLLAWEKSLLIITGTENGAEGSSGGDS